MGWFREQVGYKKLFDIKVQPEWLSTYVIYEGEIFAGDARIIYLMVTWVQQQAFQLKLLERVQVLLNKRQKAAVDLGKAFKTIFWDLPSYLIKK
ncbi:hypothetical protein [Paenibacillus koleovorans]|uniref:hypothetical protein n=1 Tax=Paenibacillus koleovorans TaxID=121608 RepID=UPI001FE3A6EC|nr:hypothetical protein [Paenibacillus koleovorans]